MILENTFYQQRATGKIGETRKSCRKNNVRNGPKYGLETKPSGPVLSLEMPA